ncbi:MAG: RNA polymerase sigma-70 factor, partial [Bacteroidia bacterium]|nr:RNA polymerase sigma-70 factor [Bacteroidia bacterium]
MQQSKNHIRKLFDEIFRDNKNAFDELFRAYYANLLRFARNYVADTGQAEEIVSDVFVWIWMNRAAINTIDNPEVYLFTAVKNRCFNASRSNTRLVSMDEYRETENNASESPLTQMEQKELSEKLHAIIENLPEQQRIVFRMIKENGLTAKQTAQILNLSSRTVETHIYKAVQQLEKEITEYLG